MSEIIDPAPVRADTAMVGNVPISVGFGNGAYAPAGYLVATIVLTLFAIGYAAMSKHITAPGAFYGYISHGLGRVIGLGAGFLTALAYMVFEASLIGIFSFFGNDLFTSFFGVDVPWIVFALVMPALMALSVVFTGGGPQGWSLGSLNPLNGFHSLSGSVTGADGNMIAVAGSAVRPTAPRTSPDSCRPVSRPPWCCSSTSPGETPTPGCTA